MNDVGRTERSDARRAIPKGNNPAAGLANARAGWHGQSEAMAVVRYMSHVLHCRSGRATRPAMPLCYLF